MLLSRKHRKRLFDLSFNTKAVRLGEKIKPILYYKLQSPGTICLFKKTRARRRMGSKNNARSFVFAFGCRWFLSLLVPKATETPSSLSLRYEKAYTAFSKLQEKTQKVINHLINSSNEKYDYAAFLFVGTETVLRHRAVRCSTLCMLIAPLNAAS